ncbi:MAG: hypothetical protein JKX90_00355 [Colwellia sp.]|nr:hypothetical protein [Colwellia sp.]
MKAIALMVFLLLLLTSILAHADHLALQQTIVGQQDCQLCNQGIDTPPALPQIKTLAVSRYNFVITKITTSPLALSYFVQPPSRAPPFSQ